MINHISKFIVRIFGKVFIVLTLIVLAISFSKLPSSTASNDWRLDKVSNNHQIEGYVSKSSYLSGSVIDFHISCESSLFQTEIYRMGWYGGSGANLIASMEGLPCKKQALPKPLPKTGLVVPDWKTTFKLQTPDSLRPGIYLAKLTNEGGYQNYVPFVIRANQSSNPYLFVHALNTENAYNKWGSNSLYSGYTPKLNIDRAVAVSFNRPFVQESGTNDGSGDFLRWEYPMILFLEKYGYQCDYLTDVDIHEHPALLQKYKTVILAGHDEYWSKQMLDGYEAAVKKGVNLAVFGANTAYRPIRYLPDPYTKEPDRVMVSYKDASLDPELGNNSGITVTALSWREKPLLRPESELLGIGYRNELYNDGSSSAALVVKDEKSWIFRGTGLKNGDEIPGIIGYEYDQFRPSFSRSGKVDIVFHSPLISNAGKPDFADSSYYKIARGGGVFDAGTIDWPIGLDEQSNYYSPELVQITRNILEHIGQNP